MLRVAACWFHSVTTLVVNAFAGCRRALAGANEFEEVGAVRVAVWAVEAPEKVKRNDPNNASADRDRA